MFHSRRSSAPTWPPPFLPTTKQYGLRRQRSRRSSPLSSPSIQPLSISIMESLSSHPLSNQLIFGHETPYPPEARRGAGAPLPPKSPHPAAHTIAIYLEEGEISCGPPQRTFSARRVRSADVRGGQLARKRVLAAPGLPVHPQSKGVIRPSYRLAWSLFLIAGRL